MLIASCLCLALQTGAAVTQAAAVPADPASSVRLEPGKAVGAEIKGGQSHRYVIRLEAGELLEATVEQQGVDVALALIDPGGESLLEVDSPNGRNGPEPILAVAERAGDYILEVRTLDPSDTGGRYEARVVERRPATSRDRDLAEATMLFRKSIVLSDSGKSDEAVLLAGQAAALYEKVLGPEHIDSVRALNSLGVLYYRLEEYSKAEPLLVRALAVREKVLGPDHLETASTLDSLARLYERQGQNAKAEPLYVRAFSVRERVFGPEHPDTAKSLNNLARFYKAEGQFAKAEELVLRALAINEKRLGPEHPETAIALNNLAAIHADQGALSKAEPLYLRAFAIFEKVRGPADPDVALMANNLADLYKKQGRYLEARPFLERALFIYEQRLGPEHDLVAATLSNLAGVYRSVGEFSRAEPLFARALAIIERTHGPEHKQTANALMDLAGLYKSEAQYAKAEPLYVRAVAYWEKALGPEHPYTAFAMNNLAELYILQGNYAKAEPLATRALAIREKTLGPEHADTANSLNNLAMLYVEQGQYDRAEPLLVRALAVFEKALGPEHPRTANMLDNLASLYHSQRQYALAELPYVRALAIREKALGPEHPSTAYSLNNLAALYADKGEFSKAEALYARAIAIRERTLGPNHPLLASTLVNLVALYARREDYPLAISTLARANDARERDLQRNLAAGSEREKLLYLALSSGEVDQTLSLHARNAPEDSAAARIALELILRRKGRVLDVTTRQIENLRKHATPEDAKLLDELAAARSSLSRLTLATPDSDAIEEHRARIAALEITVEQLQGELGRRSAQFAVETAPVTLTAVCAAIPADARLVEFASYRPWDAKGGSFAPRHYSVYVTGHDGHVAFADLGEAALIDALVAEFRAVLRSSRSDIDKEIRPVAQRLDAAVMKPVRRIVGPSQRLLVSPEGALNLVPFAALVDERGKYLVETYDVQYLTSGRDLLRLVERRSGKAPVIVANPDFGEKSTGAERGLELGASDASATAAVDLSGAVFGQLPGTAGEASAISRLLKATILVRGGATEAAIKRVDAPTILHIATHGYFLRRAALSGAPGESDRTAVDFAPGSASGTARGESAADPLLRSGLAMAGANARVSGEGEDGLLTAVELTGLNLWGTRLVVLSACDTGVGEVKTGEGVYGLRRSLVLAGAETTMVSLWPVSDAGTRDLMIAFYRGLLRGTGRGEALRNAQMGMLHGRAYRHPYYWASFIQSGAWGPVGSIPR